MDSIARRTFADVKSNLASFRLFAGLQQSLQCRKKIDNRFVMRIETAFELFEFCCQLRVCCDHLAQSNKRTYDPNACLDSDVAVQHAREHDRAVLCKGPRKIPSPATPL